MSTLNLNLSIEDGIFHEKLKFLPDKVEQEN